jgi:peptidoglycan/LPS O-acetylase OafA/YrhL
MAKTIYPLTSVRFFAASLVLFHHSVRTFLPVFSARGVIHMPILSLFLHFRWVTGGFYPVYLTLCVGLSLLSFRYFETPARLWLLERFHRRLLRNPVRAPSMQQPALP